MKKILSLILCLLMGTAALFGYSHPSKERITLSFDNAYLISALRIFDKTSSYKTLYPERVYGRVTAQIDNLPPLQALDSILRGQNYEYLVDGKNILIYKKGDTEFYQHNFVLQHTQVKDVKEMISNLTKDDETTAYSDTLNTVSIRASLSTLKEVHRLLQAVDVPPKQVLMKAKILEIKKNNGTTDQSTSYGADFTYVSPTNENNQVKSVTNGFSTDTFDPALDLRGVYAQVISGDIAAYLHAVERTQGYELLASPWVTAVNHHPSELLIGSKFGYKTILVSESGAQENIEFLEVGIKLDFTPHISDDGYIRMTLKPSISEGKIVDGLPQENTTETSSEVLVKNGETLVIGGLTQTSETEIHTGLPILSRLPLFGALFGKIELVKEKRDLMILITPTIIEPGSLRELNKQSKELEDKLTKTAVSKLKTFTAEKLGSKKEKKAKKKTSKKVQTPEKSKTEEAEKSD